MAAIGNVILPSEPKILFFNLIYKLKISFVKFTGAGALFCLAHKAGV